MKRKRIRLNRIAIYLLLLAMFLLSVAALWHRTVNLALGNTTIPQSRDFALNTPIGGYSEANALIMPFAGVDTPNTAFWEEFCVEAMIDCIEAKPW